MRKRRLKLLGKILLAFVLLLIAFLLFERFRGQVALASYQQKLIAQGEKLSPEDFRSSYSETDNGAAVLAEALERLQEGVILSKSCPPRMRLMVSGHAVVGFRESEWMDGKVTNHWDELASDLKRNEAVLSEIRAALAKPVLNNNLDFAQGTKIKFSHLWRGKQLAYWFGSGAVLALRENRLHDAARDLAAEIGLPRLMAEDRLIISELVRIALGAIARADTWEALQASGWIDGDLVLLQKAWEAQSFAVAMAGSLEGERVFCSLTSQQMRESNEETYLSVFGDISWLAAGVSGGEFEELPSDSIFENLPYGRELVEFGQKQIYCRVWRFSWSHQAQLQELEELQHLIEVTRLGVRNKSYQSIEDSLGKLFTEASKKNFYDRLRYPGVSTVNILSKTPLKALQMETSRSLALCAIALKRYSLRHDKYPASLNALVPDFLPAVPMDYMDGKPIKYRFNSDGGFTLYSVGEDGKDDGGDATLLDGTTSRDLWRRRDYVWPATATSEEVEQYRREAGKD